MVGAADVTNGVRREEAQVEREGDGGETKVIVSVIETSKRGRLEDLGVRGVIWQREKEAHLPVEWLIQERRKACQERKQEENQRQGEQSHRRKEA